MSSADAPSAAVRTMTPPCFGAIRFMISFRRWRSSSSSRRETPWPSPLGTKTTNLPGSEISVVSRAPRLHRVLDRLHHDRLAAADQVLDLPAVPLALKLRRDDLVDVEKAVLLEADLDECGFHPRQDVV